jgi:hypothetical protein
MDLIDEIIDKAHWILFMLVFTDCNSGYKRLGRACTETPVLCLVVKGGDHTGSG